MSVRKTIPYYEGIYFITFTCWRWLRLFELTNGYYAIYKWFDVLKKQGHYITGYVIMPNHFHGLLAFRNTQGLPINNIIGNGKRFIAYEIIKQLEKLNEQDILPKLGESVKQKDMLRGKLHEVFEPSFDWKECETEKFIEQKLNYIHNNPCSGKWNLAENPWDYIHSSAQFYINGIQGIYEVLHYQELDDIDLTKPLIIQ
ncbi:MAG: hypothetical protein WD824_09830 [Cyclobacteriaceae bacterium]